MTVVDITEEEALNEVPGEASPEVSEMLSEEALPYWWVSQFSNNAFVDGLAGIYDSCMDEDDELDGDKYIEDLEALAYGLWNQRNILLTVLANIQDKTVKIPEGFWTSHDTVSKLVLFCLTGRDFSSSKHSQRIFTVDQFESLCKIYDFLPPEWRERAGVFIQTYAANHFKTEFATTP